RSVGAGSAGRYEHGRHVGPELFGDLLRGPVEDLLRISERHQRADQLREPGRARQCGRRDGVGVLDLAAQPADLAVVLAVVHHLVPRYTASTTTVALWNPVDPVTRANSP